MRIEHVNEGLAVRASLSKVTKNRGTRSMHIGCNDLDKNSSCASVV